MAALNTENFKVWTMDFVSGVLEEDRSSARVMFL